MPERPRVNSPLPERNLGKTGRGFEKVAVARYHSINDHDLQPIPDALVIDRKHIEVPRPEFLGIPVLDLPPAEGKGYFYLMRVSCCDVRPQGGNATEARQIVAKIRQVCRSGGILFDRQRRGAGAPLLGNGRKRIFGVVNGKDRTEAVADLRTQQRRIS